MREAPGNKNRCGSKFIARVIAIIISTDAEHVVLINMSLVLVRLITYYYVRKIRTTGN